VPENRGIIMDIIRIIFAVLLPPLGEPLATATPLDEWVGWMTKQALELPEGDLGAKRALMLPVSAPFHSSLMQPAADAMREALAGVSKSAPVVPLIANVRAAPVSDPDEIAGVVADLAWAGLRAVQPKD